MPRARSELNVDTNSRPFITATPRIEMNPTAAEMLKFNPTSFKAHTPPTAIASTLAKTTAASRSERNAR